MIQEGICTIRALFESTLLFEDGDLASRRGVLVNSICEMMAGVTRFRVSDPRDKRESSAGLRGERQECIYIEGWIIV